MALSTADKVYISLFHDRIPVEGLAKDTGCSVKQVAAYIQTLPPDSPKKEAAPSTFALPIQTEMPPARPSTDFVISERLQGVVAKMHPDKPSR